MLNPDYLRTVMPKYLMPINALQAIINPLDGKTWKIEPIDPDEVRLAADRGEGVEYSWQVMQSRGIPTEIHRLFHVRRIAYLLATTGVGDEQHKIHLIVSKDNISFYDGNHRAAAAIVRGDDSIELYIADSGELDLFETFPGLTLLDAQ